MANIPDKELSDAMEASQASYREYLECSLKDVEHKNEILTRANDVLKEKVLELELSKAQTEDDLKHLKGYTQSLEASRRSNASEQTKTILSLKKEIEDYGKLVNEMLNNPAPSTNVLNLEIERLKAQLQTQDAEHKLIIRRETQAKFDSEERMRKTFQDLSDEIAALKNVNKSLSSQLSREEKSYSLLLTSNSQLRTQLEKSQDTDNILFSNASFDMSTGNCDFIPSTVSTSHNPTNSGGKSASRVLPEHPIWCSNDSNGFTLGFRHELPPSLRNGNWKKNSF